LREVAIEAREDDEAQQYQRDDVADDWDDGEYE
jgi:hypothetical protein